MKTNDEVGCIVMSLRRNKEDLVVRTERGDVVIEVSPLTMGKCRVVVRAPKSIEIGRNRRPEGGTYV